MSAGRQHITEVESAERCRLASGMSRTREAAASSAGSGWSRIGLRTARDVSAVALVAALVAGLFGEFGRIEFRL